jgi:hypothetical protein
MTLQKANILYSVLRTHNGSLTASVLVLPFRVSVPSYTLGLLFIPEDGGSKFLRRFVAIYHTTRHPWVEGRIIKIKFNYLFLLVNSAAIGDNYRVCGIKPMKCEGRNTRM